MSAILTHASSIHNADFLSMPDAEFEVALYADLRPSTAASVKAAERRLRRTVSPAPCPIDAAWMSGYSLGESGYEVDEVEAPSGMSRQEREAFMAGVSRGAIDRWREYALHLAETQGPDVWGDEAEFGSAMGHMG